LRAGPFDLLFLSIHGGECCVNVDGRFPPDDHHDLPPFPDVRSTEPEEVN
jgi:hypothetical protein